MITEILTHLNKPAVVDRHLTALKSINKELAKVNATHDLVSTDH